MVDRCPRGPWSQHRLPDHDGQLRIKLLSALNRIYKHWASIFDKDAVLTSALLDRLLHHAETVLIEGKSYRSKDQIEI